MPQRKDYDVYSGNHKVGEIWSNHPVKSDYETDLNIKQEVVDLYFKKMKANSIKSTDKYQEKLKKMEKAYKVREAIGWVFTISAIPLAILVMLAFNSLPEDFALIAFIIPPIIFALGAGLRYSDIEANTRKGLPQISWGSAIGMFFGFGFFFLIADFLITFFCLRFFL